MLFDAYKMEGDRMFTEIKTATLSGVKGYPVTVETDLHRGMPGFHVVGLADTTIRESCRRIRPAIMNSGGRFPSERVTVNLVPAGIPKEGSHFDLPIALGVMLLGKITDKICDTAFIGEVSLSGAINGVKGVLPLVMCLRGAGIKNIVVPRQNADEAAILEDVNVIPVQSLREAAEYAGGYRRINAHKKQIREEEDQRKGQDFDQVVGQESVKRAIVIGAGGGHGMLLIGNPGCGKTMMAKRVPGILPELTYEEKIEITGVYSVAGLLQTGDPLIRQRPFRSPHHTITAAGLIGGGQRPRPGELSLAHRGVLFLDEFGEFDTRAIDAMRQPLEEGTVRINRNFEEIVFPSRVMIIISANPCKCGNLWNDRKVCTCTKKQLEAYRRKLTGPFADRIDMYVKVSSVAKDKLGEMKSCTEWEGSESMREKVNAAREIQKERYKGTPFTCNGELNEEETKRYCTPDSEGREMIAEMYDKFALSMRAHDKLLKISRTIADIDGSDYIKGIHVAEALMYRTDMDWR